MSRAESLAVYHSQPFRRNLARCYSRCIHVTRIDPETKFKAHTADRIRETLQSTWKLFFILFIAAKSKRPIIHPRNNRSALVPGRIVVENIESNLFRQLEFFQQLLFTVLFRQPYAVSDQGRIRQRRLKNVSLQIAKGLIPGVVAIAFGNGEEADRRFDGRARSKFKGWERTSLLILLILYQDRSCSDHRACARGLDSGLPSEHSQPWFSTNEHRFRRFL